MSDEVENVEVIADENKVDPDEDKKKTLGFVQNGLSQLSKTADNTGTSDNIRIRLCEPESGGEGDRESIRHNLELRALKVREHFEQQGLEHRTVHLPAERAGAQLSQERDQTARFPYLFKDCLGTTLGL